MPWQEGTLTPGLTTFFTPSTTAKRSTPAPQQRTQPSMERSMFQNGTQQVEDAVTSLAERRHDLERDIQSLEVFSRAHSNPPPPVIFCDAYTQTRLVSACGEVLMTGQSNLDLILDPPPHPPPQHSSYPLI